MRNSRLGCFTFTGIIAALITAVVIAVVAFTQGGVLYSPGDLNAQSGEMLGGVTSHAETGGECKACHVAPWSSLTMADRCTTCHVDVAAQMRAVASLHGAMKSKNPRLNCAACHPDHRGSDAPLTVATAADFPHEALGFSLAGHQFKVTREAFVCADCHSQSITTFDPLDCQVCHQQMDAAFAQQHALDYGRDCLACHDGVDRFGKSFSHSQFQFPLTGKHLDVNCAQCHAGARAVANFALAPMDCYSCHTQDDEHNGRFGTDCSACHTPTDWEDAAFDHSLSNFPLTGAHQQIDCEKCHVNAQFAGTPSTCVSCHADPVFHAGVFSASCESCHNTSAWSPASFNGQHTFPLNHGESGMVSCATCHPSSFTSYTCYGCHEHNEAKVRSEHLEEGISNFQNCMECHPTGNEHEGGGGWDDD
jgi:hypothetical protein